MHKPVDWRLFLLVLLVHTCTMDTRRLHYITTTHSLHKRLTHLVTDVDLVHAHRGTVENLDRGMGRKATAAARATRPSSRGRTSIGACIVTLSLGLRVAANAGAADGASPTGAAGGSRITRRLCA